MNMNMNVYSDFSDIILKGESRGKSRIKTAVSYRYLPRNPCGYFDK